MYLISLLRVFHNSINLISKQLWESIWDKYVAFNAFYSDMCQILEDDMILKAAYKFFFQDEDAAQGKIWKYMQAVKKI